MVEITLEVEMTNYLFAEKLAKIHDLDTEDLLENLLNNRLEDLRYANPHLQQLTIM